MTVANTLTAQVGDLKKELNEKKQNERAQESKVKDIEKQYKAKLDTAASEVEKVKKEARDMSKERDQV